MYSARYLLDKVKEGKTLLGAHILGNDYQATELMGRSGIDYFWLDTEHTMIDKALLLQHLVAAQAAGVPVFVRVAKNEASLVKPLLDAGVQGIIFPMIHDVEEAEYAVKSCYYPPDGIRGIAPGRAINFGLDSFEGYLEKDCREIITLVQIETKEAVENIDDILHIPGLDVPVIGPMDLAGAFGKLGKIMDPDIVKIFRHVIERAHQAGRPVMVSTPVYDTKTIGMWKEWGADMITAGTEYSHIAAGMKKLVSDFSEAVLSGSR